MWFYAFSYEVMMECWAFRSEERVSFGELQSRLEGIHQLPNLQSDDPFPPGLGSPSAGPGQSNLGFSSSAETNITSLSDGTVQVFATQNSAQFQRNTNDDSTLSKRSNNVSQCLQLCGSFKNLIT